MLRTVPPRKSPFGRVMLVVGPEQLLVERAVAEIADQMRAEATGVDIEHVDAAQSDGARLAEATSASLFSSHRGVVITDISALTVDVHAALLGLAKEVPADLGLVLTHPGGAKGKGLLDKLKAGGAEVIERPAVKAWELPQFVANEARRLRGSIDAGAAQTLVDAVGHDLRALAAAVEQLLADGEGGQISADQVRRYFGGRAEVTSFGVADAALAGRAGPALEQLRWALATGVAPVLVTSALASGVRGLGKLIGAGSGLREADLAREVGVPPWKLKTMRAQARGWDQQGLAAALVAVAAADADIKGAADDAAFALERAVLAVAGSRRQK